MTSCFRTLVVVDTTKVDIFKQITTSLVLGILVDYVVVDTTKVDIFKQITTYFVVIFHPFALLLIPQR